MNNRRFLIALMGATALCVAASGAAWAQTAASETTLGEIVVTASRQSQALNRVPMSIAAVTQDNLDRQGILNMSDLSRAVPALTFRPNGAQPIAAQAGFTVAIRGILSTAGSPTTGIYLDDIPIQRRNTGNAAGGVNFPKLFDLQRIEVLRGPQGTLYGGSSEGGAIRFITPTPSLTKRSGAARGEVSFTQGGDPSQELDAAVGGPIVQDKLGFRVSGMVNNVGGYVDHIAPSTGQKIFSNSNSERIYAIRGALLWQPTERLKIQPTAYWSSDDKKDVDSFWLNVPGYTLPSATFGATGAAATGAAVRFTRPALVYQPLNYYGVGKTGETALAPRKDQLAVYALNVEYDFGWVTAKSITGYVHDTAAGATTVAVNLQNLHLPFWGGYSQLTPNYIALSRVNMQHKNLSQELRFNSKPDQRLTWVAGLFYNYSVINSRQESPEVSIDDAVRALRGVSATVFYGADFNANNHVSAAALQDWNDITLAGFAEANFAVTDKLKATAGVRVSKEKFRFNSCTYGFVRGILECSVANANLLSATTTSSPVSPKVGLTYQIDDRNMIYATAAKGFRAGGINTPVPNSPVCGAALALIGKSPVSFEPDYVTSYEGGAKVRLFGNRAAINASVFRIDWTDLQLSVALPGCPFNYTANAGQARSQGFDTQAQIKLFEGLTADISVAYTDARYTKTTSNRDQAGNVISVVAFKGDQLPVAPWTLDLGLNYDFSVLNGHRAYAHIDYQYYSPFHRTVGPGAISYAADVYQASASQIANARLGMMIRGADVSLFGRNIFNSQDILDENGGRVCGRLADPTCAAPAQISYLYRGTTFRPREFGLTVNYKY